MFENHSKSRTIALLINPNLKKDNFLQEIYNDEHYELCQEGDCYTLMCKRPQKTHSGRYTLVVKLEKNSKFTSAYLDVQGWY